MKKLWIQFLVLFVLVSKSSVTLRYAESLCVAFKENSTTVVQPYAHTTSISLSKKADPNLLYEQNNALVWHVTDIPHAFTEAIISWNALRPPRGFFSFYLSVKSKEGWSPWQKMADWGCNTQKSYFNANDPYVHTKHVRVEMQKKDVLGQECKIKVTAHEGARLKNIKRLHACTSNNNLFHYKKPLLNLPSLCIKTVRPQSQQTIPHPDAKDLCCSTATNMVLRYFFDLYKQPQPYLQHVPGTYEDECFANHIAMFAHRVCDKGIGSSYGNWLFNVAQSYHATQGKIATRIVRLNSFHDLYAYLQKKIPVAVSIRGILKEAFKDYPNGHFVVVVGWDQEAQKVLCIDPAFPDKDEMFKGYRLEDFAFCWAKSRHLAFIMEPSGSLLHHARKNYLLYG